MKDHDFLHPSLRYNGDKWLDWRALIEFDLWVVEANVTKEHVMVGSSGVLTTVILRIVSVSAEGTKKSKVFFATLLVHELAVSGKTYPWKEYR